MSGAATIYVVDDDEAVRDSIEALLLSAGRDAEAFASGAEFLEGFDASRAACVLLDVRMPGMDGLTLLETLRGAGHALPVVMLTAHGDLPSAVRAMRAGAADFLEKPFERDRLFESIDRVARPAAPAPEEPADADARARFERLTPREMEVMREMVTGHPNKIIAHNLGLSPRTVEIHRGRVMRKSGADSLSQLVRLAIRAGHDPEPR